jgi:hypothetical protein
LGEAVLENALQLKAEKDLDPKHLHAQLIQCDLHQFLKLHNLALPCLVNIVRGNGAFQTAPRSIS